MSVCRALPAQKLIANDCTVAEAVGRVLRAVVRYEVNNSSASRRVEEDAGVDALLSAAHDGERLVDCRIEVAKMEHVSAQLICHVCSWLLHNAKQVQH